MLKEKFDGAHEVKQKRKNGRRMLVTKFSRFKNHKDTDLVYLVTSPDYCEYDVKKGSLGTSGRECDPVSFYKNSSSSRDLRNISIPEIQRNRRVRPAVLQPRLHDEAREEDGEMPVQVPLVLLCGVRGVCEGCPDINLQLTTSTYTISSVFLLIPHRVIHSCRNQQQYCQYYHRTAQPQY